MKNLFLAFILILGFKTYSQEFDCDVVVNYQRLESLDPTIADALERGVFEFINARKWTGDVFKPHEKIVWSILIELQTFDGADEFTGTIQVQSRRPVYASSYNTSVWSFRDQNVSFKFDKNAVLEYSESTFLSNLTALMSYYSYMVLGYDYETFKEEGGTKWLTKAQEVAQFSQASGREGWATNEQRNRYWLVENHLNPRFKGLRKCMYEYHRLGLDQMSDNPDDARDMILKSLEQLKKVHDNVPNSFNMRVFFDAKADEIVKIFQEADRDDKTKLQEILGTVDPANIIKYQEINN